MMTYRVRHLMLLSALGALCLTATSQIATAGPFAGVANQKLSAQGTSAVQKVHYRKKYHKHGRYHRKRRHYRRYHRNGVVRAPFTRVERRRRRVAVDAPFASVRVGRGVRVRAPFVDLWIPRYRRGYRTRRYW